MSAQGSLSYFGESSELHVHLLNIDLFPWSLGPILYTVLAWRGKLKHSICDSLMMFTEEKVNQSSVSTKKKNNNRQQKKK